MRKCVRAIQAKFKAMPRKYDRGAMNHAIELRNTMKLLEVDLIIQRGGSHICVSALVDDVPSKTMTVDANGLREAPGALPSIGGLKHDKTQCEYLMELSISILRSRKTKGCRLQNHNPRS